MEDDEDHFFFESDHLALRGNKDYRTMLKSVLILENLKIKVIKDIEQLASIQQNALKHPFEFLEDLKNCKIDLPSSHTIPQLPAISWSKYGIDEIQVNTWKNNATETDQDNANNIRIRGRAFDQSKPETFNQLWTCQEQRRLEELLKEFPEEEVESRRWSKIAKALGNRTTKQVMSRVQKYFLKLQQAGLPIPGRSPRLMGTTKIGYSHRHHHRNNKYLQKRSTFFPAQDVPVFMEDNQNGENFEVLPLGSWTPLEMLQAIYERRTMEESSGIPLMVHHGINCIGCNESIVGTRWTDGAGSDWCSDCLIIFQPTAKMTPISSLNMKECTDDMI